QQLVVVAALAWLGSLFSPFFGVAGDRIGHRTLLVVTRGIYGLLAAVLTALTLTGSLQPWHVFAITALAGLMRPSDMVMRHTIVAQTIRPAILLGALGISRTTSDTARVAGALTGMGAAYVVVSAMYVAAFLLSLGIAGAPAKARQEAHPVAELKEAFAYVWSKPDLLGAFSMAFLVNLLAFPFVLGLLPYVAKDVYAVGQAGLGYLAAAFWIGALLGSVVVGAAVLPLRAARAMLWAGALWFAAILAFGQTTVLVFGLALLFGAGFVHSFCMTPMAA